MGWNNRGIGPTSGYSPGADVGSGSGQGSGKGSAGGGAGAGLFAALGAANPLLLGLLFFGGNTLVGAISGAINNRKDKKWYEQEMPKFYNTVGTMQEGLDLKNQAYNAIGQRLGLGKGNPLPRLPWNT